MTAAAPPAILYGNQVQAESRTRLRLIIRGAVQGVGFRPFIHNLAGRLALAGWVQNTGAGVVIEVEGPPEAAETFLVSIDKEKPPHSFIQSLESTWLPPARYDSFEIRHSEAGSERSALVLPDLATCAECVREIFDSSNRRHRYPFTNCTHCGPRFSIIEALPYDRANTAMKHFALCPACREEFENPADRRFHAQPNACPECGPQLELRDASGKSLKRGHDALIAAADEIRHGRILALKGLGGFHLIVRADDDEAVRRLRLRKHREAKPFALMFPSLESVRTECRVSAMEERLLCSSEAPIVLLDRMVGESTLSSSVAPGNPCLGVMLPYTPLHHLFLAELGFPVVATSGNLSEEPICIDEDDVVNRLNGIADFFLAHNRPIVRSVDDSVVRVIMGRETMLRRSRGYAPLPVTIKSAVLSPILATGGHMKNTVALATGQSVFLSQHIGDLENVASYEAFLRIQDDLQKLFAVEPLVIAYDAHPDYRSTRFALELLAKEPSLLGLAVQHHHAHALACMAENELAGPVLAVSWDGTGYGLDGAIWGGEFFHVTETSIHRCGRLRTFPLPGGERAIKETWRIALGLLHAMEGDAAFEPGGSARARGFGEDQVAAVAMLLKRNINAPLTSSMGRLFDGIAALIGLNRNASFEGQAAMELEYAGSGCESASAYTFKIEHLDSKDSPLILDWAPVLQSVIKDIAAGIRIAEISARFHNGLVEAIAHVARRIGEKNVVLSGGCFQNRRLIEATVNRLRNQGFHPYWHQRVPPNDGGIALGQILAGIRAGL